MAPPRRLKRLWQGPCQLHPRTKRHWRLRDRKNRCARCGRSPTNSQLSTNRRQVLKRKEKVDVFTNCNIHTAMEKVSIMRDFGYTKSKSRIPLQLRYKIPCRPLNYSRLTTSRRGTRNTISTHTWLSLRVSLGESFTSTGRGWSRRPRA